MNNTVFLADIPNGKTFLDLLKYLKHVDNGMLVFSATSIKYNDLINKVSDDVKKNQFYDIGNTFEINTKLLDKYEYKSNLSEYTVYFNIKSLRDKIKNAKIRDVVRIYKGSDSNLIYINVLKAGVENQSVSCMSPLNMNNSEIFSSDNYWDESIPNCKADPSVFKDDCSKIIPTEYPEVILECKDTYIEGKATSALGNDGHYFCYGVKKEKITLNFDLSKLRLDEIDTSNSPKINVVRSTGNIIIRMNSTTYKGLSGLASLSKNPINFYFTNLDCIKLVSTIGAYGTIRTFIKIDEII